MKIKAPFTDKTLKKKVYINAWEAVVVPKAAKVCFREFFLDLNVNAVTSFS